MNTIASPSSLGASGETQVSWITIVFLTAVFLVTEHHWFFSLKRAEGFATTVDAYTTLVDQGSIVRRVLFLALGAFAASGLLRTRRLNIKINGALGWTVLLFISWAFLSLIWSGNPAISCRRLILFAVLWFSAFSLSQYLSLREIVLWIFFSTLVFLHVGLLAEIMLGTFHPLAEGYRFTGTVHPNVQGIYCTLLLYASVFLSCSEKRWRHFLIATAIEAFVFLFLTKSRSSLGFALLAPAVYCFLALTWSRKGLALIYVGFCACLLLLFLGYLAPTIHHLVNLGREEADAATLGSRIPLWKQLSSYISMHPIQGYGYECFWSLPYIGYIASDQGWVITEAHSTYISMCLGLGLVGCITFGATLILGIRCTLHRFKASGRVTFVFCGIILIFLALSAITESIVILPNTMSLILMIIVTRLGFLKVTPNKEQDYD